MFFHYLVFINEIRLTFIITLYVKPLLINHNLDLFVFFLCFQVNTYEFLTASGLYK